MAGTFSIKVSQMERQDVVIDNGWPSAYHSRFETFDGKDGEIELRIRVIRNESTMSESINKITEAMKALGFYQE